MKIFILEDEIDKYPRNQLLEVLGKHKLHVAKSFPEAKKIYRGNYDLLLLDHDMRGFFDDSDHPNTGFQFVKWLVDGRLPEVKPTVVLHSQNPVGRENMRYLLEQYGFMDVSEHPFSTNYVKLLRKLVG